MNRLWIPLLLLTGSCAWRPAPPRARHVVVITLDTTRADYLSAYWSARVSTPNLDRLAREGAVFEQAMSVAPLTLTAHASLFTGLLPPHHGVRDNGGDPLGRDHATLAELLRARGFQTAAFVGSVVLQSTRGLARGFDVYHDGVTEDPWQRRRLRRPANEVVDDAMEWLAGQNGSPFFMWVHLYDAHAPYDVPEPYRALYADDPYAGEIAFADAQVGRVLDALDQRRLWEDTTIVIAADHGESFGSHGEQGHGIFVYQDVMHVPLIVRAPGIRPRRIAGVTSLVDVMPTVLDLVGAPPRSVDGASLVPLLTGATKTLDRDAYAESMYPARFGWSPLRALREGRFKLIVAPRPELYDLETDPTEQENLYARRPALAAAMTNRLSVIGRGAPTIQAPTGSTTSSDVRERLAALGYVSGGGPGSVSAGVQLPDPKDRIGGREPFAVSAFIDPQSSTGERHAETAKSSRPLPQW
jgi:choline-sulfatase